MKSGRRSFHGRGGALGAAGLGLVTCVLTVAPPAEPARAAAPTSDSTGTDFWLGFPANFGVGELTLFIAGGTATTGTVAIPGLAFSEPFSVTPGAVTSVSIPSDAQMASNAPVEDKGIHVTAGADVSVYGLNRIQFTTDAYLGLPTDILGTEYLVLGSPPANGASEGAVIATTNGTTVTVTPTADLDTGQPAGTPFSVIMNQGQTFQFGSLAGDVSGTVVTADKPIGVYGGNACANIPDTSTFYCDHIVEQMPPVTAWGKSFLTVPLATRLNGDTFRIVAAQDGTAVRVNGSLVATLNRGGVWQQIIDGQSQISADKPILVAQYSNGTTYDNVTSDPFEMLIPPTEQFLPAYTVSTPATGFSANFINVVAPTASIASVKLDGAVVPAASFTAIGSSGFSGAQLTVDLGSHTVSSSLPIGAYSYGFADFDSYGYPGGMSLAPVATVNTLTLAPATETLSAGANGCVTATVKNNFGEAVAGVRVDFARTGANPGQGFAFTDDAGHAQHCYDGANAGDDTVVASLGALTARASKTWTGGSPPPECINFPDFSSTAGLNLGGNASKVGNVLRLTPALNGQSGTSWTTAKVHVADGFTSDFDFRFTAQGGLGAADGITFAIQNSGATATGISGGSLGYEGIDHSLVVEFDTWNNGAFFGDPDNNHVAVHSAGAEANSPRDTTRLGSAASLGADLVMADGAVHHARVSYDPADGGSLAVFVDDMADPKLTVPVDLDDKLGLSDGTAWAGFTSATGAGYENHDLLDWRLCDDVADTDEDVPVELFVLTNDPPPPGVGLWEITAVTQPLNGTVEINDEVDPEVEDTVTFSPARDWFGSTSFTYTVDDGDGHTATHTVLVWVGPTNDEPVVTTGPDKQTAEGSPVQVGGAATDVDGPLPLAYHWEILDGPDAGGTFADENAATTRFTPQQDGVYVLQLEACDAEPLCNLEVDDDTVEVTVANVAPTVTLPADRTVIAGVSTSVAVTFSDPSGDDTHTAVIDWGDGSAETTVDPAVSGFTRSHTFTTTGVRTVEACVSDDDDTTCDTMTITVVPPTSLKIADASIIEPDSGTASMTFTITASPVPTSPVTVVAKTVNGSATAPSDYTALPAAGQTVTFAAGQATRTVTVPIVGDLLREPNESFTVTLSDPVGATIGDGSGLGRIRNDDECTILGTTAGETLNGTAGNDVICGLGGNDVINGLGGNDTVFGGDGSDTVRGGSGNDTLRGQNGDDVLAGEAGNDVIEGGAGVDEATWAGAPGAVTVDLTANTASGWGTDILATLERARGGSFGDTLRGNGLRNSLWGGDGNDTLLGRSSDDLLDGQNGNDTLRGETGNDTALGGAGDDRIDGGAGVDLVKGDAGNDQVAGGAGNDNSPNGTTAGVIGGSGTNSLNGGLGTDYCSRGVGDTRTSCELP